jgi:alkyl sulfatase BDS1-like metallo-beta-lactamase superfamily hydrolase
VAHSVRNIYNGYLGWWDGDATKLARPGVKDMAQDYVDAMGGEDKVIDIARDAYAEKNYGWAAEVLTHVNNADPDNMEARDLKAQALREWGYAQTNIYWRGYAISNAAELDGTLDRSVAWDFANPAIVKVLPTTKILETERVNLNADRAQGKELSINIKVSDTGEVANYTVRNEIAVFSLEQDPSADATLSGKKLEVLGYFASGDVSNATIEGNSQSVDTFFSLFDHNKANDINLVLPN